MKKYQIIYADPPWNYKVYSKKGLGRSAESHYPTMSIEDICALPVGNLADKDCALFLWVTIPCLLEGLSVLKAWGFTYKTVGFVWVKQNRKADSLFWGMGYWTRSNVELCILATKGHPKRINAAVHQVIVSHIEEHSKKPQEARERIVSLMGDLPRMVSIFPTGSLSVMTGLLRLFPGRAPQSVSGSFWRAASLPPMWNLQKRQAMNAPSLPQSSGTYITISVRTPEKPDICPACQRSKAMGSRRRPTA